MYDWTQGNAVRAPPIIEIQRSNDASCFIKTLGNGKRNATGTVVGVDDMKPISRRTNKNLAIAKRSRVSCAHNTLRACIGLNITP